MENCFTSLYNAIQVTAIFIRGNNPMIALGNPLVSMIIGGIMLHSTYLPIQGEDSNGDMKTCCKKAVDLKLSKIYKHSTMQPKPAWI